ncbi:MAG: S41 family peptidase [Planctomycetaceae bacterium]
MRNGWLRPARTASCLLILLCLVVPVRAAEPSADDADYYELMKTFVDSFEQIDRNYVKDVDRRELIEAAIEGMLTKLDPYSSYISPDELARFTQDVEQEFGGIGIQVQIDPESKRLTVMTPLPGTPAYKAGIHAGDIIMEIEGKSTEGFSIQDAVKLLKGKPGEEVTIGVLHVGDKKLEQIKLTRDIIHVSTVLGDRYGEGDQWDYMLDPENGIGYVRLTHFSRHTTDELRKALDQLSNEGMKALVLDLRFNPGGLLTQARDVADLFIRDGKIVSTRGRNTVDRVLSATRAGTYPDFPMVVLVNRYSASASEIVSACLQDHKRAIIVGERTWGKGSVQNVIDLDAGKSALKLTTASYHRPSGQNIHRFPGATDDDVWGVMPDEGNALKMDAVELRQHLEHRRDRDVIKADGPPASDYRDRHLARALDVLKEKLGVKPATDTAKSNGAPEPPPLPIERERSDARSQLLPILVPAPPRAA